MSFVYHHRPAFYGTIRLHNSNGVFDFHTYLLEVKDTWVESDGDISFTMEKYNSTKTLQDYADENGFNILSGDPLSYNNGSHNRGATLAAYQIHLDSGVTVPDLSSLENISVRSGLSAIPSGEEPVEVSLDDQNTKIYTLGRKVRVRINGTLNHNPDQEVLIIRNNRHSYQRESGTGWFNSTMSISGSGTYNFGSETSDDLLSRKSTTSGVGLIFTGDTGNGSSTENWNPRNAAMTGTGTWKCRGGVIQTNKMINFSGTLDVVGTTFSSTLASGSELEWRNPFGNASSSFQGTFYKMYIVDPKFQPVLEFKGGGLAEVYGSWWEKELYNLDLSTNATDVDIGASAGGSHQHHDWHIVNSATGSDIKHMWRKTTGSIDILGNVFVKREVAVNIKDGNGSVVEGCQVYVIDNPSDYAKNATYPKNTYSTTPTFSRASITNGYITYNYADAVEYLEETDSNGDTPAMKILVSTSMHNARPITDPDTISDVFPAWEGSAFSTYANNFDDDRWKEVDGNGISYTDWDTDRFAGYFKVDRRGNDNTNADLFTFKFCSYGHNLAATTTTLKGLDTLNINWTLFEDLAITHTKEETDDYQAIDDAEKFYNKAKAYLTDNYKGETETIVSRSGITVDAQDFDVVVDANAESVFHVQYNSATGESSYYLEFDNFGTQMRLTFTPEFEFYDEIKNGVFLDINSSTDVNSVSEYYFETTLDSNYNRYRLRFRKPYGSENGRLYNVVANGNGTGWNWEIISGSSSNYLAGGSIAYLAFEEGVNDLTEIPVPQPASVITIKASTFVGNIQTTGDISLLNGAEVIGTYGENTVLPWDVANVEATATLQLFNMTKNIEVENLVVAGTSGNKVESSGTYTGQEVSVGDNIRLRITCQAGTSAFLPYEAFGVATSVGISFEADQQPDTIYNENGINADNLTTLSADYPNVQIDISDGDGIADAREFYAFYVKQTTTSTGIEQWFGGIDAIDHMNYRVNTSVADIKLQNTGSIPLVISGARIFRDDGTSILHAELNDQPMTQDNGELIQYIKGQVNESLNVQLPPAVATAINDNATISGIDKNTKIIPALL